MTGLPPAGRRRGHSHHSADARPREHSADATLPERDGRRTAEGTGSELGPAASGCLRTVNQPIGPTDCPQIVTAGLKNLRKVARRTGRFPQLVDPRSRVNGLFLTGSPGFREVSPRRLATRPTVSPVTGFRTCGPCPVEPARKLPLMRRLNSLSMVRVLPA